MSTSRSPMQGVINYLQIRFRILGKQRPWTALVCCATEDKEEACINLKELKYLIS